MSICMSCKSCNFLALKLKTARDTAAHYAAQLTAVDALRAQLATVEKDRDELVAALKISREPLDDSVATENAANARVKELEAALDPTVDVRREYVAELMANAEFDETADAIMAMDGLLHAIRARAGLTKEGK